MSGSNKIYWVLLVALMLSACSENGEDSAGPGSQEVLTETQKVVPDTQKAVPETQKVVPGTQEYYFLESVELVEQAGRTLQVGGMTSKLKINEALEIMDRGLQLAFQVENEFLKSLDARLGKNYQRYFVKGIEAYRLGIEAGIQSDQQAGLQLLGQWAEFWSAEKTAIQAKLHSG